MSSDKHCCVPGCKYSGGTNAVLHKFPNPETERERFNTWLYAIGGDVLTLENEHIYKYRRVCRSHFMHKYLCRNNKLSNIAVPTLNMPDVLSKMKFGLHEEKTTQKGETGLVQPCSSSDPGILLEQQVYNKPLFAKKCVNIEISAARKDNPDPRVKELPVPVYECSNKADILRKMDENERIEPLKRTPPKKNHPESSPITETPKTPNLEAIASTSTAVSDTFYSPLPLHYDSETDNNYSNKTMEMPHKSDNNPSRNVSTTRGNKRVAPNTPPEVSPDRPVSTAEVRSIINEVMQAQMEVLVSKLNSNTITITSEIKPIRDEISDMKKSLQFLNSQYEDLLREHSESKEAIAELQKENSKLKASAVDLQVRINNLEQSARSSNIEIQCVPENKKENIIDIIKKVGNVISCNINEQQILHCTRIAKLQPENTRPRSIVAQFTSPRLRDEFLACTIKYNKMNKANKLNTAHLGFSGTPSPIFITEHLSPTNKALHAATRIRAKEKGYKFVWVRGGRIFARRDDESEYIFIKNIESINKIV